MANKRTLTYNLGFVAKLPDDFPHFLNLADTHLQRVLSASWKSPEWIDIGTFGLYCLKHGLLAVALKVGETTIPKHWEKAAQAKRYSRDYKLPDIAELMMPDSMQSVRPMLTATLTSTNLDSLRRVSPIRFKAISIGIGILREK